MALLALVDAWRPRARSGMRTSPLAVSVLNTVLAVWTERAGSALLRQLTAIAEAATQELPVTTLAHGHQADRPSVALFVRSVAVLSLVATAAAQAGPLDGTWNRVSGGTEPVVVATSGRT
jgi:hypothetical protein